MSPQRTLMDVVRLSTGYLAGHGSESPRLDAEILAATALGVRRLDIYLQFDRPLEEAQLTAIRELVRQRGEGSPVAHLTGQREFYGRTFTVSPDVLIPRPETETLVTLALGHARTRSLETPRVVDIGTGSGCIAVTLAAELPDAEVVATDVSAAAVVIAEANVRRHSLEGRMRLLRGSWCEPLRGDVYDIVVANPPYVATADIASLARDVRDHEPPVALDGGPDGLDAYRTLLPSIADILAPDGWVAVEIDTRAARAVEELARHAFGDRAAIGVHDDLSGRPRVVTIERSL